MHESVFRPVLNRAVTIVQLQLRLHRPVRVGDLHARLKCWAGDFVGFLDSKHPTKYTMYEMIGEYEYEVWRYEC